MIVCIAEKPSVGREIAEVLGAKERHDGYYQGNGYQITWTFGHFCTLKEPHDYAPHLKSWGLSTLPILPKSFGIKVMGDAGVKKQFKTIEKLIQGATEVVNCGDAGQEGELIQRWVLLKAKCKVPVKRLWISSLTKEAIVDGFKNLKDGKDFDRLYAAGSARAIGDWLLGINATRLYTLKYSGGKGVLSIGRVQTPTLALIVERYLEIENFKPSPYWELKTRYREVNFSAAKGRFLQKEKAQVAMEAIKQEAFTIKNYSKKEGKETPPRLFDLTALQVECNKKFGFSADQTLKLIQQLYERKLVTYPRVDTTYLPNDMYPKIAGILGSMKAYEALTAPLRGKPIRKSKKVFDDKKVTDHHAIIPTHVTASGMNQQETMVYQTIALRFIAAFYPDCIVSKTAVLGEAAKVEFKANGKQIIKMGWRDVYALSNQKVEEEQKKGEEENQMMPAFEVGESGPHQPTLQEKETKPPKQYSEATLLRAMETAGKLIKEEEVSEEEDIEAEDLRNALKENGIGRPSTRAAIIETLFRRKYIQKQKKNLIPTQTGIQLIQTIKNDLLKSVELTGQWEYKLRQIEKGTFNPADFREEMQQMLIQLVHEVKNDYSGHISIQDAKSQKTKPAATTKSAEKTIEGMTCPKCTKGKLLKGKTAYGCENVRHQQCNLILPFEFMGKKITDAQWYRLLEKNDSGMIKGFQKDGQKVSGKLSFTPDFKLQLQEKAEDTLKCPICNANTIKGKTAYGCEQYKTCGFKIPFENYGKKLTSAQFKAIVSKGKTNLIKGFKTGNGTLFNAYLSFDEKGQIKFLPEKTAGKPK
ncbi:DNA topoisomerase 3 [Persicobacter psychrovividus]|uniref:DNA topoisomerase n=1 Tax=Persicobacter psychrovividus TaxID=387638 RepID=A0ABN6L948_9BACT|nr:DNA topoisomerase III [Persicobacter psychrovividus]